MKIARFFEGLTLTLIGIAAIVVLLYQAKNPFRLFAVDAVDPVKDLPLLTFLVSILVTAYGLDRVLHSRSLQKQLASLIGITNDVKIALTMGLRRLEGRHEIYESRARLWNKMEKRARTIVCGAPKAPDTFFKAIAERIKERKRDGHQARFDVVLSLKMGEIQPEALKQANEHRLRIFDRAGVADCVHLYIIESTIPLNFDVLIIDTEHVNIAMPSFAESHIVDSALEFENQPRLAKDLAGWFDSVVLTHARPYEQWLQSRQ